jgi:Leucine Rich Repeat (LRR) protein
MQRVTVGCIAALALLILTYAGCAASEEQTAIAAIKNLGGKIKTDEHSGAVVEVDLSGTKTTDDDLACLKPLAHLRLLNCSKTPVRGPGLDQLAGLGELQTLFLVGSELDDAGLAHLKGLTSLRTLHLGRTRITNAGLPALALLSRLRTLSLGNTRITDAGLGPLKEMRELGTLVLRHTHTTPAGVQQLRQTLLKTQIER